MKKLFIILLLPFFLFSCVQGNKKSNKKYLVVLSLDGFRWDYPDKANTPTLDSLAKVGVKAKSLKPCFPTKTFPNHYSIATGLYPDHHGLVLNRFHAPDLERNYSTSDRESIIDGEFYGGKPIWNLAEEQGVKAATLFWVGASANINGEHPSFWSQYNESLSFQARIDSVYNWLNMPKDIRPQLIMFYYHEPDYTGHTYGPEGEETIELVEQLDEFLADLFTKLRQLPDYKDINFVITSDHGMSQMSPDRVILMDKLIDTADIEFADGSNPIYNFKVKKGKLDKVANAINSSGMHITAWKHDSIPEKYHYGTNVRTHDLTVVSDSGWSIFWSWKQNDLLGAHGFRNDCKDMHAIFYAAGPAFKRDVVQPTFNNVDIYPLMGKILGLKLDSTDGKLENVSSMLNHKN